MTWARDRAVRCYVAEPDWMARHLLSDAIARDADAQIVGATGDEGEILDAIETLEPDALFVDVRMLSEDVRRRVANEAAAGTCVIWVSAVAADATAAFASDATDFLTKPLSRVRVASALERVRRRLHDGTVAASAVEADVLVVQSRGGAERVPAASIDAIIAMGYVVHVMTQSHVIETTTSLLEIERRLSGANFIRTHRSAIVNSRSARRLGDVDGGCGRLLLDSGRTVPVSRRRMADVRRVLLRNEALPSTTPQFQ